MSILKEPEQIPEFMRTSRQEGKSDKNTIDIITAHEMGCKVILDMLIAHLSPKEYDPQTILEVFT